MHTFGVSLFVCLLARKTDEVSLLVSLFVSLSKLLVSFAYILSQLLVSLLVSLQGELMRSERIQDETSQLRVLLARRNVICIH